MPVTDIRLKIGFLDHPKVKLMVRDCGPDSITCLLRLWMHAAVNAPRGDLAPMTDDEIEAAACWPHAPGMLIASLRNRRLLDGTSLHDWEQHQGWAYHSDERSRAGRIGANARWDKKMGHRAMRMRAACESDAARCDGQCPSPTPTPTPTPKTNTTSVGGEKTQPTWRTSYLVYKAQHDTAVTTLLGDGRWIAAREKFNPGVDVILTVEKAASEFWGTEAGWKHKRKSRTAEIDWPATYAQSVSRSTNRVWLPRAKEQTAPPYTPSYWESADAGA